MISNPHPKFCGASKRAFKIHDFACFNARSELSPYTYPFVMLIVVALQSRWVWSMNPRE